MKMTLIGSGKFAQIPEFASDMFNSWMLNTLEMVGRWLVHSGVPLAAELMLIWGMGCIVVGISGSEKWLGRGVRSILVTIFLAFLKWVV